MNIKKCIKGLLVVSCVSMIALTGFNQVGAEDDFETNKRDYIERCSSSNLTKSEIELCERFNQYLKEESASIASNNEELQSNIDSINEKITAVHDEIDALEKQINEKQETIDYVATQITKKEEEITYKETVLRDRMYEMQTYVNSNQLIDFILGAADFSDLFSRIEGVNEITANDKELISSLNTVKKELEETKQWEEEEKVSLLSVQQEQVAKQDEMNALIDEYTAQLNAGEATIQENESVIAEMTEAINASRITEEQQAWLNSGGASGGSTGGEISNGAGSNSSGTVSGDASSVVAYATSKVGSPYVYGAAGPNSFDCSGLTSWAYAQIGVSLPRTTYSQIGVGREVGWSELQPGDLVFFSTGGWCSHVGMYVGGGMMVHAGTPSTGVEYTNLNYSYWMNTFCGARRIL